jgi:hypothetical protein
VVGRAARKLPDVLERLEALLEAALLEGQLGHGKVCKLLSASATPQAAHPNAFLDEVAHVSIQLDI